MTGEYDSAPPTLRHKQYEQPSVFEPKSLLREAKRQKALPDGHMPPHLRARSGRRHRAAPAAGTAEADPYWACYHTKLCDFEYQGIELGVVGYAVGAPFAVLVAEELFASGYRLLISMTSSGQITVRAELLFFVLIEKALRDEGTSYHYRAPFEVSNDADTAGYHCTNS